MKALAASAVLMGLSYLGYAIGNPWTNAFSVVTGMLAFVACFAGLLEIAE